jgi:hypothetical protein
MCQKQYQQADKDKIAEHNKQYQQANKDKIAEHSKHYREANKEKIAERNKQYREANKEKISEQKKQYREANKEKMAEHKKQYQRHRLEIDPHYRMIANLRSRLNNAFNGRNKSQPTKQLLGIDIGLFNNWIRFQLPDGYSVNDVGPNLHLDHVLPLSSFNLENSEEQKKACSWINIAPVPAEENIKKGDQVDNVMYHKQLVKAQFFEQNVLNFELN